MNDTTDDDVTADWGDALSEQANAEGGIEDKRTESSDKSGDVTPAELATLHDESDGPAPDDINLEVILDIPVTISLEIGHSKISIRNLLQLNQGSVVELDRLAGEPLDVLVNGTLIAHGEVVVVNEKYGIRLTDVISPAERVKKLK